MVPAQQVLAGVGVQVVGGVQQGHGAAKGAEVIPGNQGQERQRGVVGGDPQDLDVGLVFQERPQFGRPQDVGNAVTAAKGMPHGGSS